MSASSGNDIESKQEYMKKNNFSSRLLQRKELFPCIVADIVFQVTSYLCSYLLFPYIFCATCMYILFPITYPVQQ